jgi:catalase
MHEFGRLVLNKNPENFHRDVEQAAFSPGSMVPGIEDSPDPLLQFCMFFYRDAQYQRIGVNLHQVSVNCPFMVGSYASLNFDGGTRNDANYAGNPQYVPNSFKHKFLPDTAEAPYAVAHNIVSRKSHYYYEGRLSDYDQARELYSRVMMESQRHNLHFNTLSLLRLVRFKIIKVRYLAQLWNIDPSYARTIYDMLPESAKTGDEGFEFAEVQKNAKGTEVAGKEGKFRPSRESERLVGFSPEMGVYNL